LLPLPEAKMAIRFISSNLLRSKVGIKGRLWGGDWPDSDFLKEQ